MVKTLNFTELEENKGYYNGGWVKTITGINKNHQNGYSLEGNFVDKEGDFIYKDGLYLMCDIEGSRNHQLRNYFLYEIIKNESKLLHSEYGAGKDWALKFWDIIEKNLNININTKEEKIKEIKEIMKKYNISQEELKVEK